MRASTRWRPQAQLVLLLMLLLLLLLPAGCGGSSVMPQPAVNFASTSHHGIVEGGKGFLLPMSSSLGIHAAIQAVKAQPSARQASPRRDRLQDSDFVPKSIDSESDVAIAASSVYNEELLEEDSDEGWESMLDRMLVERDAANVGRVHPILPLGTDPKMCSAEVERWADEQRRQYKCGDLHQSRIKRLDSCGFNWHIPEKGWMVHFSSLCMHHQRHGSADVGVLQNGTRVQLGAWLSWQRSAWRRGKLPSERSRLLLSLGVRKMVAADSEAEHAVDVAVGWLGEDSHAEQPPKSVDSSGWEGMYGELLLFRMRLGQVDNIAPEVWRGSSPIPQTRRSRRRKSARPGSLDQHQRDTAERVEQLASWVLGHKEAYKLGRLSGRWQTKLESAGVIFDQNRVRWVERYRQLLDYKRESNGTWTGRLGKGKGGLGGKRPRLAQWVKRQVRASQQGLLSGARCRLLERLGISHLGETDGGDWKVMFAELRRYQNTCNDRSAGFGWTVSPKLGGWVHQQRILHRSGDLRPMRERLLRGTGLSLAVGKRSWNGRLVELEAFRARYGHTNVPGDFLGNRPLANWVHNVRSMRKRGALSSDREDCLKQMGFTWDLSKAAKDTWEGKARELMEFRMAYGHASVPQSFEANPSLGRWVARMRHMNTTGLLTKERAGLLLGLGLICLDRVERRGGKGVPRKGEKGKQEEEEAGGKEGKISHKSGPPNIRKRKRCERPKVCGGGSEDRVEKNVPTAARRKKRLIAKTKGKVERGEAEQPAAVSGDTCEGKAASSAG